MLAHTVRTDHKTIVLSHAPIGFAEDGIMHQCLEHRRFQIVRHDALGNTAPTLESAPMQANPGRRLLVKNDLRVLMAAVA